MRSPGSGRWCARADSAEEVEEILEQGSPEGATDGGTMERGFLENLREAADALLGEQIILLEEIGSGIHVVGRQNAVGLAVPLVGAGGSVCVNLRTAGGALLRVVHGRVDADFLKELGRRRRMG